MGRTQTNFLSDKVTSVRLRREETLNEQAYQVWLCLPIIPATWQAEAEG
jgi:hypothetical protein